MREKTIEQELVTAVRQAGGIAPKFVSPGLNGMPDRLILLPGGKIGFVEVKTTGEAPRALQMSRHKLLRSRGFQVFVLDDNQQISQIISAVKGDAT